MTNSPTQSVEEITRERKYWFVRTDSGKHFDSFYENGFVGIGWNAITLTDIRSGVLSEVKAKIARTENLREEIKSEKGNITGIYNKIVKFDGISQNDIVIIPSARSEKLAFGVVQDERTYWARNIIGGCDYNKRREVKWVRNERLSALDPTFYKIIPSMHAVSAIRGYDRFIDNLTSSLYTKNGYSHFVLEVTKLGDINLDALLALMEGIKALSKEVNEYFELPATDGAIVIKLNVQSRGRIELSKIGAGVILIGTLLTSCSHPQELMPNIEVNGKNLIEFARVNSPAINRVDTGMKALEAQIKLINRQQ